MIERRLKIMERPPIPIGGDKLARATMAALLASQKGDCNCKACQILRSVAEEMTKEFVPT